MKQVTDALAEGFLKGTVRLGINRERVARGERPLARAHLPFNRRRPTFGPREIEEITTAARHQGLDREQTHQLKRYLWDVRKREAAELQEEFMLMFNAAYEAAEQRIWHAADRGELRSPRTCIQVYTAICHSCAPRSNAAQATRRELAQRCRLSNREISRHTAQLERLELLRTDPTGRCVTYLVLPVGDHGFPLWHGDRIAMLDAAAETREQLDRERQLSLV